MSVNAEEAAMQPDPSDLRLRVVHAYERGEGSRRQLATRFAVSGVLYTISSCGIGQPAALPPNPTGGLPCQTRCGGTRPRPRLCPYGPRCYPSGAVYTLVHHHPGTRQPADDELAPATTQPPAQKNVSPHPARAPRHAKAARPIPLLGCNQGPTARPIRYP
jgi:hypothetical protein